MVLRGLTSREADKLLEEHGPNELQEVLKVSPLKILFRQVKKNSMVYLLTFAMIISFLVPEKQLTGWALVVVILIVIGVGFFQEYRAEQSIKALKSMIMPKTVVLRDGKQKEVESRLLVPGDIVMLRTGERVPADCVVLDEKELRLNEAVLTGESKEIRKTAYKKKEKPENHIFMGTYIVNGRATARVLKTGMDTEFGKIADLIGTAEKELPLQKKVNLLTKYLAIIALSVSFLTGITMLTRVEWIAPELIEILIVVIAISVASIPEGLPVVLITTLAAGARRMAVKNAIVNRMSVIEALGEATVICTDKTGTLTRGEMTVKKIWSDYKFYDVEGAGFSSEGRFLHNRKNVDIKPTSHLHLLIKASVLCNDSKIERSEDIDEYHVIGSPTEGALMILGAKANIYLEDINAVRKEEIPFNSHRKMMSVLTKEKSDYYVYTKGALEFVLPHCTHHYKGSRIDKLSQAERKAIMKANESLTTQGYRTIAVAYKKSVSKTKASFEEKLVLIGILGLEDPPRPEVKNSIKQCDTAGIRVIMLTGDNKETAKAIAREIGIKGNVLEGFEIDDMTEEELSKVLVKAGVFARVKPEHKLRIVKNLKSTGEIVAMTGDGVNDAPALKESHIGIAMGKNGTDVTREVADITLKDDNFATIVCSVEEGRTIFNNIRKFTSFQISTNIAQLSLIFVSVMLNLPLPLIALQILFMNLLSDEVNAITLGFNKSSDDIMKVKPRKKSFILNKDLIILILVAGIIMTVGPLLVFNYLINERGASLEFARTMALMTIVIMGLGKAFIFRSFRKGVLNRSPFVNPYLVGTSTLSLLLLISIVYIPALNPVFETLPVPILYWLVPIGLAMMMILIFDIIKYLNNKYRYLDFDE
ncbi:MAG: cation-translocating P-type ATPase [Candidatus Woesearchaeota archaeon]